jgi:hypothetical protein
VFSASNKSSGRETHARAYRIFKRPTNWPTCPQERIMKFMLTFTIKPETRGRDEAIARFKKTGGQPPKGATLIGRWTAADFSGGYVLLESESATALTEFSLMLSDLMEMRIVPVIEDASLAEVLGRAGS